jgi:hypothetical protein
MEEHDLHGEAAELSAAHFSEAQQPGTRGRITALQLHEQAEQHVDLRGEAVSLLSSSESKAKSLNLGQAAIRAGIRCAAPVIRTGSGAYCPVNTGSSPARY